jgi:hypothetical protein
MEMRIHFARVPQMLSSGVGALIVLRSAPLLAPPATRGKTGVEPVDCRQDMGGIGPLDALRFELAARLTGGQKGVEEAVAGIGRLCRGRRRLRYGGSRYGRKAIPLGIPILGLRHCVLPFKAVSIRKGSTVVSHAPARRAWARFI